MSGFLGRPAAHPRQEPDQARTLDMLATLFVVALVVAMLYAGREIFIPIAIAIPVSFVLSPPTLVLRRWGFGRIPSVLIVILAALIIASGVGAVLTSQVSELAADLPKYQATVSSKIVKLRDAVVDNAVFAKVSAALKNAGEINPNRPAPANAPAPADRRKKRLTATQENQVPVPVEVHEPAWGPFAIVETLAGTALSSLEMAFIVVIFVIFILLQREDLRDRFIRLAGSRDLHRTTLAMNDAAARLSRYFLIKTLVNAAFGIIVAVGLYFIGIPSPILWGVAGFLLRFIPYFGPFIAAVFPMALAVAIDPGWGMALETLALFVVVETIIGQAVEPWLYGHSTGISPVAVVISAAFWWWMWGTAGLLLSTPLTVCLVVLGRHVERLAFLDVMFGDAPPLTPAENFYQRMLAGDASEVVDQAEQFLKTNSLIVYYDEVALPALLMAQVDLGRGVLDEPRQRRIKETIEEVIEELSDHADEAPASTPPAEAARTNAVLKSAGSPQPSETASVEIAPPESGRAEFAPGRESQKQVLCIAGRSFLDEAAAALLAQILGRHGIEAKVEPARELRNGQIPRFARLVCLSYLDADLSPAGARFAVRRLRRRLGEVKILAGFWQSGPAQASELCAVTKADFCATSFKDAVAFCLHEAVEEGKAGADKIDTTPASKTFAGAVEG
ncbi:MAG: AI-2E family transporter [Methylocella sp.]